MTLWQEMRNSSRQTSPSNSSRDGKWTGPRMDLAQPCQVLVLFFKACECAATCVANEILVMDAELGFKLTRLPCHNINSNHALSTAKPAVSDCRARAERHSKKYFNFCLTQLNCHLSSSSSKGSNVSTTGEQVTSATLCQTLQLVLLYQERFQKIGLQTCPCGLQMPHTASTQQHMSGIRVGSNNTFSPIWMEDFKASSKAQTL